jgi:hypothetical protein
MLYIINLFISHIINTHRDIVMRIKSLSVQNDSRISFKDDKNRSSVDAIRSTRVSLYPIPSLKI